VLAGGELAFPALATYTGPAACCGSALPVGAQNWMLRGSGSGGPFLVTGAPGAPWSARVFYSAGAWLVSETSGNLIGAFNQPLTWNPAGPSWDFTGVFNCACFPNAPVTFAFRWFPTAFASYASLRAPLDEALPATLELLRWSQPLEWLTGAVSIRTALATACWRKDHVRGNYFKLNSLLLPRAAGQALTWLW